MNYKILSVFLVLAGIVVVGASGYTIYQQINDTRCEACGMAVTPEIKQHIKIIDGSNTQHYACCQGCMFRLLDPIKGSGSLHIETYCDYYGPEYKIVIDATLNGNQTVTSPNSTVILLGTKVVASCANNRIAYNQTAANSLLLDGFSSYTMSWQKNPLPQGTPVMSVAMTAKAMALKGIAYTPPSLTFPIMLAGIGVIILLVSSVMLKKYLPK